MGKHRVPPGGPKGPDEVDYDTGYRKPPKASQFKKGQSGNKAGRPKAAPNTRTALSACWVHAEDPDGYGPGT